MENQQEKNKSNWLRVGISIALLGILFVHLFVYKNQPSTFHFIILGVLFIFGVADRFKVIKIPGFIELRDKTESIDKKLDKVVNQIQQIQTQGINVYFNPQPQTGSSEYIETKPSERKSPDNENK